MNSFIYNLNVFYANKQVLVEKWVELSEVGSMKYGPTWRQPYSEKGQSASWNTRSSSSQVGRLGWNESGLDRLAAFSTILTWSDPFKLGWKYKPSPDQKLGSGWVGVRWVGLSQKLPPPWVTNVAYLLFTMLSEAFNCSMFTELKKFCTPRSCILHCSKQLPSVIMTTIHEKGYETKGPGLGHWTMAPPEQTWHISIFFRSSHKWGPPRSSAGSINIIGFKHVIHVKNESTHINTLHLTDIFLRGTLYKVSQ